MGERNSFPIRRYSIPVVALCLAVAWFALQQWLSTQSWWPALPWLEIFSALSVFGVGVIVGLAYDDITNRDSQLWKWYTARLAVFDVTFHPSSRVIKGVDWNTPIFAVRFIKRVHAVQIELTVIQNVQFKPLRPKMVVFKLPPADYSEGEDLRIPIAYIPRQDGPYHSHWGEDGTNGIIGQTGNLVELRAISSGGAVLQTYKVFISVGEGMAETNSRYFYLTEGRDVFGSKM